MTFEIPSAEGAPPGVIDISIRTTGPILKPLRLLSVVDKLFGFLRERIGVCPRSTDIEKSDLKALLREEIDSIKSEGVPLNPDDFGVRFHEEMSDLIIGHDESGRVLELAG